MSDDLLATRRFKALTDERTSEGLGCFFWLAPEDMQGLYPCAEGVLDKTEQFDIMG